MTAKYRRLNKLNQVQYRYGETDLATRSDYPGRDGEYEAPAYAWQIGFQDMTAEEALALTITLIESHLDPFTRPQELSVGAFLAELEQTMNALAMKREKEHAQ